MTYKCISPSLSFIQPLLFRRSSAIARRNLFVVQMNSEQCAVHIEHSKGRLFGIFTYFVSWPVAYVFFYFPFFLFTCHTSSSSSASFVIFDVILFCVCVPFAPHKEHQRNHMLVHSNPTNYCITKRRRPRRHHHHHLKYLRLMIFRMKRWDMMWWATTVDSQCYVWQTNQREMCADWYWFVCRRWFGKKGSLLFT